jgi:glycosyl transferase family 11
VFKARSRRFVGPNREILVSAERLRMISVSLIGGLGNQLFQYAAGKALAERHGVSLALDLSGFPRDEEKRTFLLDRLRVPEADLSNASEVGAAKPANNYVRSLWKQRLDRLLGRAGLPKLAPSADDYREPHFQYDPAFEKLGSQTTLFGFFQSERYFSAIAGPLCDLFQPRDPLGPEARSVADRIAAAEVPVSVHIRRGDFVKNPARVRFHGWLDDAYYRRALKVLHGLVKPEMTFFVFSDDAAAAEAVLDFVPAASLVHVRGDPDRPWEDLALMARCRHHVVANSSFSWWGAWLNPSPDKVVIVPRAWFTIEALRGQNTCDLWPADWILL